MVALGTRHPVSGLAGGQGEADGKVGLPVPVRLKDHVVAGGDEIQGAEVGDDFAFEFPNEAAAWSKSNSSRLYGRKTGQRGCGSRRRALPGRKLRAAGKRSPADGHVINQDRDAVTAAAQPPRAWRPLDASAGRSDPAAGQRPRRSSRQGHVALIWRPVRRAVLPHRGTKGVSAGTSELLDYLRRKPQSKARHAHRSCGSNRPSAGAGRRSTIVGRALEEPGMIRHRWLFDCRHRSRPSQHAPGHRTLRSRRALRTMTQAAAGVSRSLRAWRRPGCWRHTRAAVCRWPW
jgi:hypothetical protein